MACINDGSIEKHYIWFGGRPDALFKKILDELPRLGGSVTPDPAPFVLFDLCWNQAHFAMKGDAQMGLIITRPEEIDNVPLWETKLQEFHDQVVRPLADRTGCVAVGITLPGNESFGDLRDRLFGPENEP